MSKFVGLKNDRIKIVSDQKISGNDIQVYQLPSHLEHLSSNDLIANYRMHNGEICSKYCYKPIENIKIALVSNWKMKCGIATYADNLWAEIIDYVGDFKIFAEINDSPTGPLNLVGDKEIDASKVISCWQRGKSLQNLVEEIKKYDPDIVVVNHEFGLFPNARHWLSLMTQLSDFRIIVIMHSIFPDHQDKIIYEASMQEIVVHSKEAKNNLESDKKISAKVYVIPHGCYSIINQNKLWDNYKSKYTFIQQGFGFKYKNFEDSIRAAAILKTKYPDIFFTALFSESPHNKELHQIYYNNLIDLIDEFGIQENVAIIRGYQSDNIINTYLRSNQVAVFPYMSVPDHEVFGASGAARLAMASGIPVISSNIPHFKDLPTIKANTAKQISEELDKLFCSEELKKIQTIKQNEFINNNSWENVALKYVELFEMKSSSISI